MSYELCNNVNSTLHDKNLMYVKYYNTLQNITELYPYFQNESKNYT